MANEETKRDLLADADDLERAARVLVRRTKRPGGLTLRVFVGVLRRQADSLRRRAEEAPLDLSGLRPSAGVTRRGAGRSDQ